MDVYNEEIMKEINIVVDCRGNNCEECKILV